MLPKKKKIIKIENRPISNTSSSSNGIQLVESKIKIPIYTCSLVHEARETIKKCQLKSAVGFPRVYQPFEWLLNESKKQKRKKNFAPGP